MDALGLQLLLLCRTERPLLLFLFTDSLTILWHYCDRFSTERCWL